MQKLMSAAMKRIGTHDGVFHCDEVLACFMLRKLPEYVSSEIIRTRDDSILDTCDIVVDVGGVYNPEKNRFDHHQRGFESTMNSLNPERPWTVKLSSAGLVYHHFGEGVIRSILGPSHDPQLIERLYVYIYENFIQEIDGIDNGVEMFGGDPKYKIHTDLCSRVSHLNQDWNSQEPFDSLKVFHTAMDMVGREFIDRIQYFVKSWWPARQIVSDAVADRLSTHESGEIIELTRFCPWKVHLVDIEREKDLTGTLKYVIYKTEIWNVQAVPESPGSFKSRLPLLEKWRGLRNGELSKAAAIDGCVFVHHTGFCGGNKTREGALEMALKSLSSSPTI